MQDEAPCPPPRPRDEAIPLIHPPSIRPTPSALPRTSVTPTTRKYRHLILYALVVLTILLVIVPVRRSPVQIPSQEPAAESLTQPMTNAAETKFLSSFFSSAPECEDGKSTTYSYGRCGETCASFSLTDMLACNSHDVKTRGCRYRHCGGTSMQCTAKKYVMERASLCANDTLQIAQARLTELQTLTFEVSVSPPEHAGATDVYLLISATDAMSGTIAKLSDMADQITSAFDGQGIAMGLGYFRDEYYRRGAFRNAVTLDTDNSAAVQNALRELRALGGGDDSEAALYAMHEVSRRGAIGWRKGARHALVYVSNAPGHEPSCMGKLMLTRRSVADVLRADGIVLYGIDVGGEDRQPSAFGCAGARNSSADASSADVGQATFIAQQTGGQVVSASPNEVVTVLQDVAAAIPLSDRIDVRDSSCGDVLQLAYEPAFPEPVFGADPVSVQVEMSVTNAICELGGWFKCQLEFVGMGVLLGLTKIEVQDVIGCA